MFAHPKISAGKRSEREGGNTGTDSTESSAATVAWFGINFCGIVGTLRRKARKINPNEITQLITATGYMFYMRKKVKLLCRKANGPIVHTILIIKLKASPGGTAKMTMMHVAQSLKGE